MDKLVLFNTATRNKLLNKRSGESKFGGCYACNNWFA